MGQYANDLINGSIESEGMEDMEPTIWVPADNMPCNVIPEKKENLFKRSKKGSEYEVSIIHRRTGVVEWTGTVTANSKKDAQSEFRKQYANIRNRYTHEYGLGIKLAR